MLGRIEEPTDMMTMRRIFENSNYDLQSLKLITKESMTLSAIILSLHSLMNYGRINSNILQDVLTRVL